ncbi:MAG: DEAD/DEAH box helicase family protein [Muribaculaceae bacterium]|nr:DEAD/DEAH box helicase family protein [Muribaculaceae bacterium]
MARKYDLITEVYERTIKTVSDSPASWQGFLRSACFNFKLRFDEQLLIYAQRPDATAVLEIERWNDSFGRWVNKGARGIAVFEDADRNRQRLKHYFDISDTHESRYSRPVPIWNMKPEYEAEVIETLENTFGDLQYKGTLDEAIVCAAENAVEDNLYSYTEDLIACKEGSLLEELDDLSIQVRLHQLVTDSVAFMIMARLGLEPTDYFGNEDFTELWEFNTPEVLNAVGLATSDIAEMALTEVSLTIHALDRQNRIIAENRVPQYNEPEIKTERSSDHERDQLHDAGRLSASEPEAAGAARGDSGQVRSDEAQVSEGGTQSPVSQSADKRTPHDTSGGGRTESNLDGGRAGAPDGGERGLDGEPEADGHDGVGSQDEQSEELGTGDRADGSDFRLSWYDREHEDKSLPHLGGDDVVNGILLATPHLKCSKEEIRAFLETMPDDKALTEFIKGIFNNDYTEVILPDGRRMGYKTYENVLHLWEGSYLSRTKQGFYDWGVIAAHFEGLRLLGELKDEIKPLPSMEGQQSLLEGTDEKSSVFSFSQEIIDTVLTRGSGVSEGKMRIYDQFQKSLSAKENADFLKNEYGWGGSYPTITGTGISEQHDGKGIHLTKGSLVSPDSEITLSWTQVEKRIAELIRLDRYLNPKEQAYYPEWLEKQEERRREAEERRANHEILSAAPPEKEAESEVPAHYEYHLGDTVYLGAQEFEILSFDEQRVMLYDVAFPLFQREESRENFDRMVAENPMNDHLKVEASTDDASVRFDSDEFEKLIPYSMRFKSVDVVNRNEIYWVTQGIFTEAELADFQNAVREYDGSVKKFYVTSRDLSPSYTFEDDLKEKVLAVVTPDSIFSDDYISAIKEAGLAEYLSREEDDESLVDRPQSIALYQVGDFYEMYGKDAELASEALELVLTSRTVNGKRVPMCGIPAHRLSVYTNLLNDRGYDVIVHDDGREPLNIVSLHKEAPVESRPIGRIDYLGSNGEVGESIEYTDPEQFLKDIKEENHYGVPMSIVLYKDKDGNTVPQGFVWELDPLPQGFKTEEFIPPLEKAKNLINAFYRDEYQQDEGADFSDLTTVGIAYTTTEDDKHEIQVAVDLVEFKINTFVDNRLVGSEEYVTLDNLIRNGLTDMSFDELVSLTDEQLAPFYQDEERDDFSDIDPAAIREALAERGIENGKVVDPEKLESDPFIRQVMADVEEAAQQEEPIKPAWEQKKRSKVQTFDLHPDIPMADRLTFDLASHEVEEVGKKDRFYRNLYAIQILQKCQEQNRFATPEEQVALSKYVGWGGLPEAFDETNSAWETQYLELKTVLTPEEYASARESTLTAFYTPPVVIQSIYKAMERMGFKDGNILEPSCGIGNFIGMLPQSMQEAKVYGVEMDKISAGIAQQLYQRSSIAAQPFEEAQIPDSFFDAVVGNVPFGDFSVADKRYDKHHFLIHDYFFAKSLDKLRPGGVMVLITSKGTMDKENSAVRKYIAQRADLLGAIRLPNITFKGNAGTEVVSDILILQKRDRLMDLEPDWVHLDTDENGIKMNSYFVQHPEMVLGEVKMVSGRFGEEMTVAPYEGADLGSQLEEAIANINGEITASELDDELEDEDNSIPADPTVRNFSYTILDDKIYYRENSRMAPVEVSATAEKRIKGMIQIRDTVRNLLEIQTEGFPDDQIQEAQKKLNELYDRFTAKYGLINSRANVSAFSQDSSFSLLSALEILDDDGALKQKADIFTKRTIKPHVAVTSVETASEALAVSMAEKARIDMGYMCSLSGKTEKELYEELKSVIFLNPKYSDLMNEPKYLMADEYLSGNVREKLAFAKKCNEVFSGDYDVNIEALEKVQPKDLTASEIFVRLGATWLPPEIVQQFIYEFLDTPRYAQWNIKVHYSQFTSEWNIEGKSYDRGNIKANSTYGTQRINAYKIIEETLNLKDVRIFDYVEDENGKKKPVLNAKETAIAQAKQEQIKQGFQDWVWADPKRRELLCKIYNEKFNSTRPREYDGSHITFAGMNPEIELREHQKNAVAHILYGGNTLLAHAVGAGKTYEMAAAAMESKRLGLCTKPLFVVPNHLTEQWAAEFLQLYPAANILVATKKDFETKNRKRFCARIATGDYDAVIIGHSQFEKIPMSIERQIALLEQERDEIVEGIRELKENRGEKFSIKQLEKSKKSIEAKLKKLNDQSRKDDVVTFEELGVDRLFVDEAHYYKNLYLYTKMRNVGGIAQTEAQKSSDLYMKCRYLDELTGGRGTIFATGTPISNSMVELYTLQRYLQYNTLVQHGLQHFDSWASSFGETVTAVELKPEGTGYRTKTRFAKFYNLPELMAMFKEVADIKTADMLDLPVPKVNFHNIAVKPSEMQKEMVAALGERAERIRQGGVDPSVDNMLRITNDGRKLALDQRLLNPMLTDFEGSKLNACVDTMFKKWEAGKEDKLTQLFFCDLSTPKNDGSFNVYDDIRKKLIERGVPANEVRFIHEADTEVKKQEMFRKVRSGEIRILMGSTQRMGAGTNVQDRLKASSDLDCPWRPSDLEQRLGRIARQGNQNAEVDVYRFVTEGTFDAYLYQLIEGKQKFVSQIMTSKSPVRSAEDIDETALSYAEIKMLATGNPHIKEKMDLDNQVSKLKLLKSSFLSEKYALEDKIIKHFPQKIAQIKGRIAGLEADVQIVADHPKPTDDRFVGMEIGGVSFTERAEAGKAIIAACQKMNSPEPVPLGKYRGFELELQFNTTERYYEVVAKGKSRHTVALGDDAGGNITRIDNLLERFEVYLEDNRRELEEVEHQFETAKVEVEKPFSREEELKEKTIRLDELNILLNLDKRENEFVEDEPSEDEVEPERKVVGLER